MREALRTLISGLVVFVFGLLWCQFFAAFWVPGGFMFLETELRWILSVGSCAACVLLPMGALLVIVGFLWSFARLVHYRCQPRRPRAPAIPRASVVCGLRRHRAHRVLDHMRGLARARHF